MSRNEGETALPPWLPLPFLVSRATRLNLTKKQRALGTRMATFRVNFPRYMAGRMREVLAIPGSDTRAKRLRMRKVSIFNN